MIKIKHDAGFYSNCTLRLCHIIVYQNENKRLPRIVDSSSQFSWYKPESREHEDIVYDFFEKRDDINIEYKGDIDLNYKHQFKFYKDINLNLIQPFITKYFTPTKEILDKVETIKSKYNIDYSNTCVLFYRGNDKETETTCGSYDQFLQRALKLHHNNNNIRFLVQSDETEFIDFCSEHLPNSTVFYDEIRHMKKDKNGIVDKLGYNNYYYSKLFLAIVIIMSRCSHVLVNSSNISLWIYFFRGNANNLQQNLLHNWSEPF